MDTLLGFPPPLEYTKNIDTAVIEPQGCCMYVLVAREFICMTYPRRKGIGLF